MADHPVNPETIHIEADMRLEDARDQWAQFRRMPWHPFPAFVRQIEDQVGSIAVAIWKKWD